MMIYKWWIIQIFQKAKRSIITTKLKDAYTSKF